MEPGLDKAHLQQIAFSDESSPADRAEAAQRLSRLAKSQKSDVAGLEASDAPDALGPQKSVDSSTGRRRRGLVPAVTVGVLLVGVLLVGVVIGAFVVPRISPASTAAAPDQPSWSLPIVQPSDRADPAGEVSAAEKLLARVRTTSDALPTTYGIGDRLDAASTRKVFSGSGASGLWIARQAGSTDGLCLVATSSNPYSPSGRGVSTCVSPSEFGRNGITLEADTFTATWTGGHVAVSFIG